MVTTLTEFTYFPFVPLILYKKRGVLKFFRKYLSRYAIKINLTMFCETPKYFEFNIIQTGKRPAKTKRRQALHDIFFHLR